MKQIKKLATKNVAARQSEVPTKLYRVVLETPNSYEVRFLPLKVSTVKAIKDNVTTTMEFKARMKNALFLKALELGHHHVLQVAAFFKGGNRDE